MSNEWISSKDAEEGEYYLYVINGCKTLVKCVGDSLFESFDLPIYVPITDDKILGEP